MYREKFEKAKGHEGGPWGLENPCPIFCDGGKQIPGRAYPFIRHRADALQEEKNPSFPIPVGPNGAKPPVVLLSMPLQEETQIKQRLG